MTTTRFSTTYEPGAVVLVPFKFADGEATKKRPAVVLSVEAYHASRLDTVIVALTTNTRDSYYGDCNLNDWRAAGLPKPTKAKGVIQTMERQMIERRLGTLSAADLNSVKQSLRDILGL